MLSTGWPRSYAPAGATNGDERHRAPTRVPAGGAQRMSREFTKVCVVGLGTMGAGIAEVLARNGLPVVAIERDEAAIVRGLSHIEHSTARAVARGKLTAAQQRAILERIDCETDLGALADVDLVVEAVPEHLDLKRAIFARMDEVCKHDTILATNTSSLSV